MKNINTATVVVSTLCSVVAMVVTMFTYQSVYLNGKMELMVSDKVREVRYVTKIELDNSVKSAVLEEREKQADTNTASLSSTVANALGVPRKEVAPILTGLIHFGLKEKQRSVDNQQLWDEFKQTRYICPIIIGDKWYFRYEDGDYPISKKDLGGGYYSKFWRYPQDDDKRHLSSISRIKDSQ